MKWSVKTYGYILNFVLNLAPQIVVAKIDKSFTPYVGQIIGMNTKQFIIFNNLVEKLDKSFSNYQ